MNKNVNGNGDQIIENTSMGQQGYDSSYEDDSRGSSEDFLPQSSVGSKERAMNSLRDDSSTMTGDNLMPNNTEITDDCVIRCVLRELGMVKIILLNVKVNCHIHF